VYSNALEDSEEIAHTSILGRCYVTVEDGNILFVRNYKLLPEELAEAYIPDSGVYAEGQFKVGKDIPPGRYILTGVDYGIYRIDNSSRHYSDFRDNLAFEVLHKGEEAAVTLHDGEYLTVNDVTVTAD